MTEACRLILDVDTGVDDAMAILYALRRPAIRLEALTTTFGNTDVDTATRNTLRILDLAGRPDVPVARGPGRSLLRPFAGGADHVHGVGGLGEVALPEPNGRAISESAPDLIARLVRENPGRMTIAAVGPVTNVALALAKSPEIASLIKRIVVMGSTLFHPGVQGIASPMADANFWNDPEAAQIVLRSGAPITLVGMDVTMQALLDRALREAIAGSGALGAKMMEIAQFYVDAYARMYPGVDGCGLHDPLAVAIAEDPTLARTERMCVDVELAGERTRGQAIADRRRTAEALRNADVCLEVDVAEFNRRFVGLFSQRA
jgi:purine nucleosidase